MPSINYWAIFNGVNLNTVPGLQIYNINPYVLPHRTLNIFQLVRTSARKLSSAFYDSRTISISLYIGAPDRPTLDQRLDQLYSLIQAQEATLVIPQSGTSRQYTATFDSHIHNSPHTGASSQPAPQGGFIDLTLNFECSDSFGYDTSYTLIANQSITGATATVAYTQGGGADTQVPMLQVKLTALTGGTGASITLGNQLNGQAVTVTRNWSQYDLLQVDSRNKTVQVNGLDVVFTGSIPEFGLGLQNPYYLDTLTTRTAALYFYVYNRFN